MKTRVFVLVLAAALAGAGSARAQLRGGTVEINPFAGYLFGGNFGRGAAGLTYPYDYRVGVADDLNYGGRIGYNFNSLFEAEFEYGRSDTNIDINPERGSLPTVKTGDLNLQYFMGYLTLNFGHGRTVGYFTFGGGAADLDPRVAGVQVRSTTRFTAAFGGGVKYFFDPHFGLRGDARLYSTYLGTDYFYCGPYYACSQTTWLSNFVLNGGLIIAF